MRVEAGSFTPSVGTNIVILNDDTIDIKGIIFQVAKNGANVNGSTGFSDSIKNRGKYELDDTVKDSSRSTTYCVYHNKLSGGVTTTALRGKVVTNGFATTGEFEMTFDNSDSAYTIDFLALGD